MPSNGFGAAGNKIYTQCHKFDVEMRSADAEGIKDMAKVLHVAVARELGGESITLRGVGKKGARVAVQTVFVGGVNPSATVRLTGPAQLIERDTDPHTIIGRSVGRLGKGKGSRSKAAKVAAKQQLYDALFGGTGGGRLHLSPGPEGWVTGPIQHPGTKGKHPFKHGVEQGKPVAARVYDRRVSTATRKAFGS